jgi:hypothetical protein
VLAVGGVIRRALKEVRVGKFIEPFRGFRNARKESQHFDYTARKLRAIRCPVFTVSPAASLRRNSNSRWPRTRT